MALFEHFGALPAFQEAARRTNLASLMERTGGERARHARRTAQESWGTHSPVERVRLLEVLLTLGAHPKGTAGGMDASEPPLALVNSQEEARMLLAHGADPCQRTARGWLLLTHLLARRDARCPRSEEDAEPVLLGVLQVLRAAGAELPAPHSDDARHLLWALNGKRTQPHPSLTKWLSQQGVETRATAHEERPGTCPGWLLRR